MMTLNYINPIALELGPISVRWYGIIIAVGILLGYFIAQEGVKRIGFDKDTLVDIIFGVQYLDLLWRDFILLFSSGHIIFKTQLKFR